MRALLPLVLALVASVSCRPRDADTRPPDEVAAEDAEEGVDPDPAARCGPAGERFRDLDWVPADTRFVAWIELDHHEFEAAAEHLGALAQAPERASPALPIYAATDLSQLGFEVSSLSTTLSFAGFAPAELLKLHGPGGVPVYVWPTSCDLDLARAKLEQAYGLAVRKAVDGLVGTPGPTQFPFDALLLRGDRAAFVPRDKAPLVLDWLETPAAPTLTGEPAPAPGPRLRELAPAPFRILLQGEALVAGDGDAEGGARTLRATAAGVEIDGTLAAP